MKLTKHANERGTEIVDEWRQSAEEAERRGVTDASAMDIYDTTYTSRVTRATLEKELLQDERGVGYLEGSLGWLNEGLSIQEEQ